MKSAFECFQEAAKCEQMAKDAQHEQNGRHFLRRRAIGER